MGKSEVAADPVNIDRSVVTWLMGAGATFILFLLSLGIKDLRARLEKIPGISEALMTVEAKHERKIAELNGDIRILEIEVANLKAELERVRATLKI